MFLFESVSALQSFFIIYYMWRIMNESNPKFIVYEAARRRRVYAIERSDEKRNIFSLIV